MREMDEMSWMRPIPIKEMKDISESQAAKNLLEGKTCALCGCEKDEIYCCIWVNDKIGWAWVKNAKIGTCTYWEDF